MFSSHPLFRIFRVVLLFSYQVSLTSYQVFAVRSLVRQRDIYYHTVKSLSTTFFSNPEVFFRSAPRGFLPGAEAGTYPDPLSLSTAFFCFFQKTSSPRRTRPLGPARLSETFRPAAARTGYAPPRRLCQRLFIFFLIFLPHTPRFYRVFAPVRIQIFLKRF